jgi:hypothetical protein
MNTDRLLRLREILQIEANTVYPKFNMGSWVSTSFTSQCGTTACAFGRAALDPVLRAQGLKLVATLIKTRDDGDYPTRIEIPSQEFLNGLLSDETHFIGDAFRVIYDDGTSPIDALRARHPDTLETAACFFGISYQAAEYLFLSSYYTVESSSGVARCADPSDVTEQHVITHIDKILSGKSEFGYGWED